MPDKTYLCFSENIYIFIICLRSKFDMVISYIVILGTYADNSLLASVNRVNVVEHDCMFIDHGIRILSTAGSVLVIYWLKQAGTYILRFIRSTRTLTSWVEIVTANNLQMLSGKVYSPNQQSITMLWQRMLFVSWSCSALINMLS